jgi:hypothetical protein
MKWLRQPFLRTIAPTDTAQALNACGSRLTCEKEPVLAKEYRRFIAAV